MSTVTEKLFHQDAALRRFEARVLQCRAVAPESAGGAVFEAALDRTAFYATSGGQPHDTGHLGAARVLEARDDDGVIWHRLDRAVADGVAGEIDWPRRFDHMQQHTGQHLLSASFIETCGAETVSFHLGAERVTIDLDRPELTDAQVAAAEARANAIVQEDRPVLTHWTTRDDLARFPLRKPPQVEGRIRVVEVSGFDFSACGGTHVERTGAIGLIKILARERNKGGVRVEFLCGGRALADYAWKHAALQAMAGRFSTQEREVDAAVARLELEARDARRRLKELDEGRLDREAAELAAGALSAGAFRLVRERRAVEAPEELKGLAGRLRLTMGLVALLAGTTPDGRVHLVFARSDDVPGDMNSVLRAVLPLVAGRGGGRPEMAQGSGTAADRLDEALGQAVRALQRA